MRILVTGGSGFIGSNFIHFQLKNDNEIYNLDKLTYASTQESLNMYNENPKYSFKKGLILLLRV